MKVLMLGWEYPPHISGGLGTACEGLTKALAPLGVDIDFVVPHLFGGEETPHMKIRDLDGSAPPPKPMPKARRVAEALQSASHSYESRVELVREVMGTEIVSNEGGAPVARNMVDVLRIPSYLKPYMSSFTREPGKSASGAEGEAAVHEEKLDYELLEKTVKEIERLKLPHSVMSLLIEGTRAPEPAVKGNHYAGDLFVEIARYTAKAIHLARGRQFDVIHTHDWMTLTAGVALKAMTGLPLVVHIHSLEFDRTGGTGNPRIVQIEKECMEAADKIIAVSYYTRRLIHERHGIPLEKIGVVHNGVYSREVASHYRKEKTFPNKVVLFLGRITHQKGPEYFVEAAAKVIPHVPDALFVMAGSGDMLNKMIQRVNDLGIQRNFLFTGFLRGEEVEQMFSIASLYVMPSVSEPFGIVALEAISCETPTIISLQSGVSEVLKNALKVDFWDVEQLANLIIGVLKYPELHRDIVAMASEEIRRIHWGVSAARTLEIYKEMLAR